MHVWCETNFKSEKGLNIHIGKARKKEELLTPEKERGSSEMEECTLVHSLLYTDLVTDFLSDIPSITGMSASKPSLLHSGMYSLSQFNLCDCDCGDLHKRCKS